MLSIYFEDKVINFAAECSPDDACEVLDPRQLSPAKVLQKLDNSNTVWVISPLYEQFFWDFCSFFELHQAAGGVVCDLQGRLLLIMRKGHWDLPKGHREVGESWEQCALREVMEECGLDNVACGKLITTTHHTYMLDEKWILKQCNWYAMTGPGGQLTPQTEEGITDARWMEPQQVAEAVKHSYETIKTVIKIYLNEN